ncbi:hypothetical protein CHS0354_008066 [Potamilus streckersoni]|uniref:receptor protein-tyrosine kinase n=1 Tax=Potamilus streckersoni TaxID=2493646 RepID=A0AAE0VS30_9BIVA|nr:hypothetical protein CHS0354_008066 [Potamilus streckersoni]
MEGRVLCCLIALYSFVIQCFTVEIVEIHQTEKECYGTMNGFTLSGSPDDHYKRLKEMYTGCTYIQGNLELTFLESKNFDLSFLSTVRVVTGYVFIALVYVDIIPLTSLKLIRGDTTYEYKGERYSLFVVVNSPRQPTGEGLKELHLPQLAEISNGKVFFRANRELCFINTILWSDIVDDKSKSSVVIEDRGYSQNCPPCPSICKEKRCWSNSEYLCQEVRQPECEPICQGRCYDSIFLSCCHPECAIGCTGPFATDCTMCKHYHFGNKCVKECPEGTYPNSQMCEAFPAF